MLNSPDGGDWICLTYFFISIIYHGIWHIENAKILFNSHMNESVAQFVIPLAINRTDSLNA